MCGTHCREGGEQVGDGAEGRVSGGYGFDDFVFGHVRVGEDGGDELRDLKRHGSMGAGEERSERDGGDLFYFFGAAATRSAYIYIYTYRCIYIHICIYIYMYSPNSNLGSLDQWQQVWRTEWQNGRMAEWQNDRMAYAAKWRKIRTCRLDTWPPESVSAGDSVRLCVSLNASVGRSMPPGRTIYGRGGG